MFSVADISLWGSTRLMSAVLCCFPCRFDDGFFGSRLGTLLPEGWRRITDGLLPRTLDVTVLKLSWRYRKLTLAPALSAIWECCAISRCTIGFISGRPVVVVVKESVTGAESEWWRVGGWLFEIDDVELVTWLIALKVFGIEVVDTRRCVLSKVFLGPGKTGQSTLWLRLHSNNSLLQK